MKNYDFTYLDDLIHDHKNQITLKNDIILSYDDIMKKYPNNICIEWIIWLLMEMDTL